MHDITNTENEEDVFGSLVPADEISRELKKIIKSYLMDYPTGNRAACAIAADEVADRRRA